MLLLESSFKKANSNSTPLSNTVLVASTINYKKIMHTTTNLVHWMMKNDRRASTGKSRLRRKWNEQPASVDLFSSNTYGLAVTVYVHSV